MVAGEADHGPLIIATGGVLKKDRYPMQAVKQLMLDHWL